MSTPGGPLVRVLRADEVPELAALLRTGKLKRYCLAQPICQRDHTLARVLRTPQGPLLLAKARGGMVGKLPGGTWTPPEDMAPEDRAFMSWVLLRPASRIVNIAAFLDEVVEVPWYEDSRAIEVAREQQRVPWETDVVPVQCRCRGADLPVEWLRQQARARRGRVVWPPS